MWKKSRGGRPKKAAGETEQLTFRLPHKLNKKLVQRATKEGVPKADVVRAALEAWLK